MSSNWVFVLNNYFTDFEARTTTVLEKINELLLQSGQKFDDKIKNYVVNNVNRRLEQTLLLFDILGSQVGENREYTTQEKSNRETNGNIVQMNSGVPSEEVEVIDAKVESLSSDDDETVKNAEGVSSSSSHLTGADDTQRFEKNSYRPSLDSIISERQSIYSPNTSNQPMFKTLFPIDAPESSPNESFGSNCEDIKQEPDGSEDEIIFYQEEPEECVVKMEDIPTDPIMEMSRENNGIQSTSYDQRWRDRPMSPIEPQSLKRQHSSDVRSKTFKRQKTTEEPQLKEPSIDKNIVFACYYCPRGTDLFVDTFSEVYDHWESNHGPNPFRFLAFGMAACVYCDKVDVFSNLQNHHMRRHHTKRFVVVDRQNKSKCGLCHQIFSSSSEMIDHFKIHHDPSQYNHISNPICLTQRETEQLINLNTSKEVDTSSQIDGFICGHCKEEKNISEITFMDHIEQDTFEYPCLHLACKFMGNSIQKTVHHEGSKHNLASNVSRHVNIFKSRLERHFLRTKVIFTNGLVLYKHNMLRTTFDDREEFWLLKERLFKQKLKECTRNDEQPESDSVFRENELENLRSKRNSLFITGISKIERRELSEVFLLICKAIGVKNVSEDDVVHITQRANAVIIKMSEKRGLKSKILRAWHSTPQNIILNKLVSVSDLQPLINTSKISIQRELTPFFVKLWHHAETARKKTQIHRFWVKDDGLHVQRNKNCSRTVVVWSKTDLMECIQGS